MRCDLQPCSGDGRSRGDAQEFIARTLSRLYLLKQTDGGFCYCDMFPRLTHIGCDIGLHENWVWIPEMPMARLWNIVFGHIGGRRL